MRWTTAAPSLPITISPPRRRYGGIAGLEVRRRVRAGPQRVVGELRRPARDVRRDRRRRAEHALAQRGADRRRVLGREHGGRHHVAALVVAVRVEPREQRGVDLRARARSASLPPEPSSASEVARGARPPSHRPSCTRLVMTSAYVVPSSSPNPGYGRTTRRFGADRLGLVGAEARDDRRARAVVRRRRVDVDEVDRRAGHHRAGRIGQARRIDRRRRTATTSRALSAKPSSVSRGGAIAVDDQAVGREQRQIERAVGVATQIVRERQRVEVVARRVDASNSAVVPDVARARGDRHTRNRTRPSMAATLSPRQRSEDAQNVRTTTPPSARPPPAPAVARP